MYRYIVFLILCLCTVKKGLCLKCYVSDSSVKSAKDIKHELKDCSEVINGIRKKGGEAEGNINATLLSCYTINAPDRDVVFKGCFTKNGCIEYEPHFQNAFKPPLRNVHCAECEEDGCNNFLFSNSNVVLKGSLRRNGCIESTGSEEGGCNIAEKIAISFFASAFCILHLILSY